MKKNSRKKRILKIAIAFGFLFLLIMPVFTARAQESETWAQESEIRITTPIPGLTKPCATQDETDSDTEYCVSNLGQYVSQFYQWFARAAGVFAVVMIVYAGFQWIFAQGNASKIEKAKTTINGALIGLVLTLGAVLLLRTINPDLVSFRSLTLQSIGRQELVSSLFCSNLADIEGSNISGGEECGKKFPITADVTKAAGFTSDYCCGAFCEDTSKICFYDSASSNDCPFTCLSADIACRETDINECDETADLMRRSLVPTYTCRQTDRLWDTDYCLYTKYIVCPAGWERITCAEGAETCYNQYISYEKNIITGTIWDGYVGIVASYLTLGPFTNDLYKAYCTNDKNAGYITDSICCGLKDKYEIYCTTSECGSNQVEVDCSGYNSQTNTCFKTHPLCYGDDFSCSSQSCTNTVEYTCPDSARCCMDVAITGDVKIDQAF